MYFLSYREYAIFAAFHYLINNYNPEKGDALLSTASSMTTLVEGATLFKVIPAAVFVSKDQGYWRGQIMEALVKLFEDIMRYVRLNEEKTKAKVNSGPQESLRVPEDEGAEKGRSKSSQFGLSEDDMLTDPVIMARLALLNLMRKRTHYGYSFHWVETYQGTLSSLGKDFPPWLWLGVKQGCIGFFKPQDKSQLESFDLNAVTEVEIYPTAILLVINNKSYRFNTQKAYEIAYQIRFYQGLEQLIPHLDAKTGELRLNLSSLETEALLDVDEVILRRRTTALRSPREIE
eukprot:TRINITY_DN3127_c0_g1_i1.p1 TRINITY_DN3127_c0_g1~~TRINITY_DN3127_c0_g1_i1.p1  ORF type:complete len:289 (-),score=58.16 TRINITY_DN3127_c0_g1_i1:145-1011(-)